MLWNDAGFPWPAVTSPKSGDDQFTGTNMTNAHFENQGSSSSGHYSRWPDPWRREDDWGPITAAVMFFIILAGLIVYGSGGHL